MFIYTGLLVHFALKPFLGIGVKGIATADNLIIDI